VALFAWQSSKVIFCFTKNSISEIQFCADGQRPELGEAEKTSFIALQGKGSHSRLMPSKQCVPTQGGFLF